MSNTYLDFIPSMAEELPSIIAGEKTTVDRLMLSAGVCGWVMDAPSEDVEDYGSKIHRAKVEMMDGYETVEIDRYPDSTFGISLVRDSHDTLDIVCFSDLTREELAEIGRACLKLAAQGEQR